MADPPERLPTAGHPWITLSWRGNDAHRIVTLISAAGLLAAIAMSLFGLPPVDLHGPLHRLGVMDPLCGGTRAAHYAVLGHWGAAWRYNPLGMLAVIAAAVAVLRSLTGLLLGRWLTLTLWWTPLGRRLALAMLVTAFVAMTARQQLRADLLIAGT